MVDSKQRFSNRVENYIRYRPGYPDELLDFLKSECGLRSDSVIGDIGSGTGILAEKFLARGNPVFGVEPNQPMRAAAERLLKRYSAFTSIEGTAEATNLKKESVDFITAGQAFHWFDREKARAEFIRVLRPGGWVVLVWNDRRTDSTPFLGAYENLLLDYSTDYEQVNHKRMNGKIMREFFRAEPGYKAFPTSQHFDYAALEGRLLSSSYVPAEGQPRYPEMLSALKRVYEAHQKDSRVTFEYDTVVFYGHLS
jgi:SAM-dependent methyltransferase